MPIVQILHTSVQALGFLANFRFPCHLDHLSEFLLPLHIFLAPLIFIMQPDIHITGNMQALCSNHLLGLLGYLWLSLADHHFLILLVETLHLQLLLFASLVLVQSLHHIKLLAVLLILDFSLCVSHHLLAVFVFIKLLVVFLILVFILILHLLFCFLHLLLSVLLLTVVLFLMLNIEVGVWIS